MDLTTYAVAGYSNGEEPAYLSSPAGMAYLAGLAHRVAGRPMPRKSRMGRGYSVHIDGVLYDTMKLPSVRELTEAAGRIPLMVVGRGIAEAFGMVGLPHTVIVGS